MIIDGNKISKLFEFEIEVVEDGLLDGKINMDKDYQRTLEVGEGKALPMIRFYGWQPWTVSLGASQKPSDIDPERLRQFGFNMVVRPTGGRAVLHGNELTYSIVVPLNNNYTAADIYREVHIFLVKGLEALGVEGLSFEKAQPNFREFYQRNIVSVSCFASSARYEIEWEGKKIVGSAQRVFGNTVLQHGSILLGKGYELLADVVNLRSEDFRSNLKEYIISHSISVSEILNKEVTFEQAKSAFLNLLSKND